MVNKRSIMVLLLSVALALTLTFSVANAAPTNVTLRPNQDAVNGWAPSTGPTCYTMVNEVIADDDNSYIFTGYGSPYTYQLFDLPDILNGNTILSVTVYVDARSISPVADTPNFIDITIKTHDVIYGWGFTVPANNPYQLQYHTWLLNPNTGTGWTVDEVNALQAGVAKTGIFASSYVRVTQCYVVVAEGVFVVPEVSLGTVAITKM